jgi:hypothetical protein
MASVDASPPFHRPDRVVDGVLQRVQAPAHIHFGLPVALLLVIELLEDLLRRDRAADSASKPAIGLGLVLQQRAVGERNLRPRNRRSGDLLGVFDVFRVGLRCWTGCAAPKRNSA